MGNSLRAWQSNYNKSFRVTAAAHAVWDNQQWRLHQLRKAQLAAASAPPPTSATPHAAFHARHPPSAAAKPPAQHDVTMQDDEQSKEQSSFELDDISIGITDYSSSEDDEELHRWKPNEDNEYAPAAAVV